MKKIYLSIIAIAIANVASYSQMALDSIYPSEGKSGDKITIYGQNFDPVKTNNVVHIGNTKATILSGNSDSLEVEVPFGVHSVSKIDVVNTSTSKLASSLATPTPYFTLTFNGKSIDNSNYSKTSYAISGGASNGLQAGDLNNDGYQDLVVLSDFSTTDSVLFYFGSPNGLIRTYGLPAGSGSRITSLDINDVDNDGDLDLIVANSGTSNNFFVFKNNGNGLFTQSQNSSVGYIQNFAAADFNNDGYIDYTSGSSWYTYRLMNKGDGTFTNSRISNTSSQCTEVGDFNEDGNMDILVARNSTLSIEVYLGNGDSTFVSSGSVDIGNPQYGPSKIDVGDFNNDGHTDILTSSSDGTIAVTFGNGDATFSNLKLMTGLNSVRDARVADLNGDGNLDIYAMYYSSSTSQGAYMIEGNGDGTFKSHVLLQGKIATLSNNSAAIVDFNGDGYTDIITGHYSDAFIINTYKAPSFSSIDTTQCGTYTSPSGKYSWNKTGAYKDTINNAIGADSIISINLTVLESTASTQMIEGCDSAMFMGKAYFANDTKTIIIDNAIGCDSIITLNIKIKESSASTQMIEGCDSVMFMGKTYYATETKTIIIDNAMGCDSIITLNVKIKKSTASTQMIEGCDSAMFMGKTYYANETKTIIIDNAMGCDSIITLNIKIKENSASTQLIEGCDSAMFMGKAYFANGTKTIIIDNAMGCDSIITLNINILKSTTTSVDLEGDDSVTYMDKTYYFSKKETIILDNAAGCDSTITVNITVNRSPKNDDCGTVLNLDGLNDYVQLDKNLTIGNSSHTIELWVKIPKVGTQNLIAGERVGIILGNYNNSPNTGWEIHDDGQLRVYWNGGQYSKYGTIDLRDNKWHHIAFVRNVEENTAKGYVDGVLDLSYDNAGSNINYSTPHRIGNDNRASGNPYFHGAMDEFRIWNVAKTPSELIELSHMKLEGNEANLVNYFDFNEGKTSSIIMDKASSMTGTLKSMDVNLDWTKSDGSADPRSFSTQMIEGCDSAMFMGKTYYTSGTETVILDNAAGCDSIVTLKITINTIVANTITTVGNQFTTNADANSYEWINCFDNSTLGETSNTYFATKAGEYAVIATSGSCVDTSNCELLVVTSTDKSLTNEGLSILPNPTNGEFVINFPNAAGNEVYISILSLQGQNIQSFVASSSISQTVDLSSYAEGTYLVRITANGTTETHRIVKN